MAQAKSDRTTFFLEDLQVGQRFASASHTVEASGWHTMAITMKLLVESGLPLAGGIIGTGGEINWPKPTRPGDTLTVVSEIEEVTPSRSRPDRGRIRVRNETLNQHGEIVQILIAKLIVPTRTTAAVESALPQSRVAVADPSEP